MRRRERLAREAVIALADKYWRAQLKVWPLSRVYGALPPKSPRPRAHKKVKDKSLSPLPTPSAAPSRALCLKAGARRAPSVQPSTRHPQGVTLQ